jgi:hypothetical protein
MLNFVVNANVETFKEYIINLFSYMRKDVASNMCHNYMLESPDCTFSKLVKAFCKHCWKTHNDEQIYLELKNMK